MKFLNKIPHVLLLLAAVCLPTANAGRLISGGDPPLVVEDRCGNTATLDCSSQNANATCVDSSRWAAAPDQPQTYIKSDAPPIECSEIEDTSPSCQGSGFRALPDADCESRP